MAKNSSARLRAEIHEPASLGQLVKRNRRDLGMTQKEVANAVGVTQRYISELETGKPKIFDTRFLEILAKLDIDLIAETGTTHD